MKCSQINTHTYTDTHTASDLKLAWELATSEYNERRTHMFVCVAINSSNSKQNMHRIKIQRTSSKCKLFSICWHLSVKHLNAEKSSVSPISWAYSNFSSFRCLIIWFCMLYTVQCTHGCFVHCFASLCYSASSPSLLCTHRSYYICMLYV